MSKNSREQLNEDEKKILCELQGTGKENIVGIAKKCGFSRQKVWRIIKRLENNKTIWGYCAVVDYEKIGLHHYTALFKRSVTPLGDMVQKEVCNEKLDNYFPETDVRVNNVFYVNGKYNWIVTFTAPGMKSMRLFCDSLMRKFGEYIADYEVLETIVPVRQMCLKNPSVEEHRIFF